MCPKKCHAINLSHRRENCDFHLYINNSPIPWASEIKFLGFYVARWGGLRHHVEYIRKKAFNRVNILKVLSQSVALSPSHDAFLCSIRSLTDYGAAVLSSASATLTNKLEVFHTCALRVALGLRRWVPNLVLRQHADSSPLALRMQDLTIRFWIKHLSLDGWSSMWDYLHVTDETDPLGSVNMGYSITELFDELEGDINHLLPFQAPEPFPSGFVSFHLSDLPFQR